MTNATKLQADPFLRPNGDGLFPGFTQTWRANEQGLRTHRRFARCSRTVHDMGRFHIASTALFHGSNQKRGTEKALLKHNDTVGAPEERRRQSCEHYVLPEEFPLPAARLIPPKCTSSQMCRSDTYVNCHYPHVVTMCPQVHACTRPPATLLWPFFHSSVIGHTSSDSRKPVDRFQPLAVGWPRGCAPVELGRVPTRLSGSPLRASCQSLCC